MGGGGAGCCGVGDAPLLAEREVSAVDYAVRTGCSSERWGHASMDVPCRLYAHPPMNDRMNE